MQRNIHTDLHEDRPTVHRNFGIKLDACFQSKRKMFTVPPTRSPHSVHTFPVAELWKTLRLVT